MVFEQYKSLDIVGLYIDQFDVDKCLCISNQFFYAPTTYTTNKYCVQIPVSLLDHFQEISHKNNRSCFFVDSLLLSVCVIN